jgi:hypothetical protein
MLPAMAGILVMPMILRVTFVRVPPTVIVEREYHAGPGDFRAGPPTVTGVIARYVSRSRRRTEKYGAAENHG